ncbi:MAG: PD40 domain-containing protein [Labilithrix sp.]|nr:PD40 domain-containing protein [Labilithrix sp.]
MKQLASMAFVLPLLAGAACAAQLAPAQPGADESDAGDAADGAVAGADAAGGDAGVSGCHARPMEWSTPRALTELGPDTYVHPFVRADGTKLLIETGDAGSRSVWVATRDIEAGATTFGAAVPIQLPVRGAGPFLFPASARDNEYFVSRNREVWRELTFSGGNASSLVAAPSSDAGILTAPTISADGTVLIFLSRENGARLRQLEADTSGPFGAKREVFVINATLWDDYAFAVSPDALTLFFTGRNNEIYYVTRPSKDTAFGSGVAPTRVPSLEAAGFHTFVRSVTADGCEIYLSSNRDGLVSRAYVATRL